MKDIANLYRRLVFAAVLMLCCLPIQGETAHAVGGIAVLGSLILYLVQGLGTLRLNIAWNIGYLTIIVNEGLQNSDAIRLAVDPDSYNEASRYITAANAAVLMVRSLLFDETEAPIVTVRAERQTDHGRLGLFLILTYAYFMIFMLPGAVAFSQSGRGSIVSEETGRSASTAIIFGIGTSIGVILPALIIYYARFSKKFSPNIAILLSIPVTLVIYMTGIRFLLLMSAAGAFILYVPVVKNRNVPFIKFALLGSILYISASTMAVFRDGGLGNASWSVVEEYYEANVGMHVEGVVTTLAKMVDYFRHHDYLFGRSSATLLVFWIPREFWPNKPTFIDHWFIREYEGDAGFDKGFSTGSTFASDAFADFGFIGGVVYCGIFFGILLALLDWLCVRILTRQGHPATVIIAPLFGGALFAVRSFNTTAIQMSGVVLTGVIFALLCDKPLPLSSINPPRNQDRSD